jgi:hypothetical protein
VKVGDKITEEHKITVLQISFLKKRAKNTKKEVDKK